MRPGVLEHGYGVGPKLLFRLIRRSPVATPDAARITFYRPDFYGSHMKKFTQQAMRGRSTWSVGDRELMAAYVSKVNDCPFCVGAHTATASRGLPGRGKGGRCPRRSRLCSIGRRPPGNARHARQADQRKNAECRRHPSRARRRCLTEQIEVPLPSASRLTRPTVSPTPSPSTCSTATDSRRANTSSARLPIVIRISRELGR